MTFNIDRSARYLLLSNIATIAIALYEGWNVSEVMWVYWCQSVVIGIFNVFRLYRVGGLDTGEVRPDGRPVEMPFFARLIFPAFFAVHYGIFHLVYYSFLSTGKSLPEGADLLSMAACVGVFIVNHAISYRANAADDLVRRPDLGSVMMYPYKRIMPMHLTIIFGSFFAQDSPWKLLLFLSLKTAADLSMHLVEHGKVTVAAKPESQAD